MATKLIRLSTLAISLAFAQVPVALACDGMHKDWILKVTEKLNLNSEQDTKVQEYSKKTKTEIEAKRHELHEIDKQIDAAFQDGSINESKIDEFASKQSEIKHAIIKLKLEERLEVYQALDDKQKQKMNGMILKWKEKHHHD